ncbi:MAG TPA: malectin domain-containing carbohydrate-binding protein [Bryobacteraceae bacterium]|nr:malectin domain-containing carbohydrate-binding protein [Bryobacteraceae bacterium]
MSATLDPAQSKAELEAVIASGIFAKAPSLALLLDYVCKKYFEGNSGQIKEYNIAVEAFGRPATFDPRQDSIVRVEAFRLRKRLKQYYLQDGADHTLQIVIPPGQYVPQFIARAEALETVYVEEDGNGNGNGLGKGNGTTTSGAPVVENALAPAGFTAVPAKAVRHRFPLWQRLSVVAGLPVIAISLIVFTWTRPHPAAKLPAARVTATPIGTESEEVRILAGSAAQRFVDRAGNIWSGDRFFHGGSVFATPNQIIFGTPDPELFRTRREGDFSYDIPLKPGIYELHLYFAETLFGENSTAGGGESSRVFRVSINGKPALWAFDVIADAGGSSAADEKVFKDISPASDGLLHVQFAGLVNNVPFLNALEIVPGIPGRMRPVRIVARSRNYTDQRGQVWAADRYYNHGNVVARSDLVTNTTDPEMFRAERFGHFTYAIPVADGRYTVTLKFAETWFGPGKPGGGGAGSRIFDVFCNGAALLRNFDVFRAAGGPQRAIEKTFHGIVPNAQGKIVLSFVPVMNYACVNAVEVVDETN